MDNTISLPDGTIYRVVPVDQGIEAIRAWAEHPWPMTTAQALKLRDRFGWASASDMRNLLTTSHNIGLDDAWFTTDQEDNTVTGFNLVLSSAIPKELTPIVEHITRATFEAYVAALTQIYGRGKRETKRGVTSTIWFLSNGASVYIAITGSLLSSTIDSPDYNEAAAGEERYFDEIMSEEEEEREVPVQPSQYQPKQ